ncbi:MAG: hypothetical protein GY749_36195 [Desulfobacteraceae bacterium]|nr:hypothetical protein [Desulfobacteraceae bacterium]
MMKNHKPFEVSKIFVDKGRGGYLRTVHGTGPVNSSRALPHCHFTSRMSNRKWQWGSWLCTVKNGPVMRVLSVPEDDDPSPVLQGTAPAVTAFQTPDFFVKAGTGIFVQFMGLDRSTPAELQ